LKFRLITKPSNSNVYYVYSIHVNLSSEGKKGCAGYILHFMNEFIKRKSHSQIVIYPENGQVGGEKRFTLPAVHTRKFTVFLKLWLTSTEVCIICFSKNWGINKCTFKDKALNSLLNTLSSIWWFRIYEFI